MYQKNACWFIKAWTPIFKNIYIKVNHNYDVIIFTDHHVINTIPIFCFYLYIFYFIITCKE